LYYSSKFLVFNGSIYTNTEYRAILDKIASARHDAVARAFINALIRGRLDGTPRSIELQGPDPIRYVGERKCWKVCFKKMSRNMRI
jgi:hypothetical protein